MIDPKLVDELAERVHARWLAAKTAAGVTSRRSETGEELMVPYADPSEAAKDLDRDTVRAVLEALEPAAPVTAATLPAEIVALVNRLAGREHSGAGRVLAAVAEVINLWESLRWQVDHGKT